MSQQSEAAATSPCFQPNARRSKSSGNIGPARSDLQAVLISPILKLDQDYCRRIWKISKNKPARPHSLRDSLALFSHTIVTFVEPIGLLALGGILNSFAILFSAGYDLLCLWHVDSMTTFYISRRSRVNVPTH